MRVTTTVAFSNFLMDNGGVYPYSDLKPTRSTFFCKWVMLQGQQQTQVGDWTEYFPVLANSMPNGLLLELISSGKGKPLPPELSKVMDNMHWWGKNKNVEWYEEVMVILAETLDTGIQYDRKELFRAMISPQMRVEIHEYFGANSMAAELLWLDWISWYNRTYRFGPKSFRGMAMYSFDYMKWRISVLNYYANGTPAPAVIQAQSVIS
jgi:hypothetical protein